MIAKSLYFLFAFSLNNIGVWLVFAIVLLWMGISEAFSVKLIEKW